MDILLVEIKTWYHGVFIKLSTGWQCGAKVRTSSSCDHPHTDVYHCVIKWIVKFFFVETLLFISPFTPTLSIDYTVFYAI